MFFDTPYYRLKIGQLTPFADQGYFGNYNSVRASDIVKVSLVCATYYQDEVEFNAKWTNFSYFQMPANWTYSYDNVLCQTQSRTNPQSQYMQIYDWKNQIVNGTWWARWKDDPRTSQLPYWAEWGFWPSNKANFVCDTKNNVYQVSQSRFPNTLEVNR